MMEPQTIAIRPAQGEAVADFMQLAGDGEVAITMQGDGRLILVSDLGPSWEITVDGVLMVDGVES